MSEFKFNQNAYLRRIKYPEPVEATIEHLKGLHYAQIHTIPFENFDIFLNRSINLEPEKLFEKLVHTNRGGYCFELNGLFLMALQHFGFDARALLGRVHITGTPRGRGHQISLINHSGVQWIADVGFGGDNPRAPFPLTVDRPVTHYGQTIRLVADQHFGYMLQCYKNGQWENLYSFDLEHVCQGDIEYGNYYTSTNPNSLFMTARVASLPTDNGLNTLFNRTLKVNQDGKESIRILDESQSYIAALKNYFGIELDASYENLKPFVEP